MAQEYPYLGASPDGFVNCTHCDMYNGLIDIKCPSSNIWKMKTPKECATDSKFFCSLSADGKVLLKRNNIYYYQVHRDNLGYVDESGAILSFGHVWGFQWKELLRTVLFSSNTFYHS